ncbi:MAG: hypothetical protein ACYC8T_27620 [Myxococcaceae bacterium]
MSQSTAGKGPGITFRAGNGSGTVRVSAKSKESQALLEVLGVAGTVSQIKLTPGELRVLAQTLNKVAAALTAAAMADEVTQH